MVREVAKTVYRSGRRSFCPKNVPRSVLILGGIAID